MTTTKAEGTLQTTASAVPGGFQLNETKQQRKGFFLPFL